MRKELKFTNNVLCILTGQSTHTDTIAYPRGDFTHPEDECIHSLDCTGGSLFLFGMIVHSEVRNHQYSMVKIQDSTWSVTSKYQLFRSEICADAVQIKRNSVFVT